MLLSPRRRNRIGGGALFLTLLALLGTGGPAASAAGPPVVVDSWASSVFSISARLHGRVNPNGLSTTYHFDYITAAAYDANQAASKDPFSGAARIPASSDASAGSGTNPVTVVQLLSNLTPDTAYRYRLVARNSSSAPNYVSGLTLTFITQPAAGGSVLADSRGWEMVTPVAKNGGEVALPESIADGGVLQAAAGGGVATYGSEASFGAGEGAPTSSQYMATRTASGWTSQNISPPIFSGSYETEEVGAPYQVFSGDLARGLLLSGKHCRGDVSGCPVPNPPLAGTDGPPGYQNYYLRETGSGVFEALLGDVEAAFLTLDPADFGLSLAGVTPDLTRGVLSTCAALTSNATEVPLGEGCDPAKQNLYLYASGSTLTLINLLPAQSTGNPGAKLAAQTGAVSEGAGRVYWVDTATGHLYVRSGGQTALVAEGATFEAASADGAFAFYTKADEHLYRYSTVGASSTDLTPGGGVEGVLGASSSGDTVYYLDGGGLRHWKSGATTTPAADADASNYPPATGTSRVSADGSKLLFVSTTALTTSDGNKYDNKDLNSGNPDSQVYLYDASGATPLTCVSCNPTNGRPIGASSISGAIANGSAPGSLDVYKPRNLSANGRRAFFESDDALAPTDTNGDIDVYQWEAQGEGSCGRAGGCVSLVSSGRGEGRSTFADASADGSDAFFLTLAALVPADRGSLDLYDARVGGGFPVRIPPIPCEGDACQSLPPEPIDPTLTTLLSGPGNPGVRYPKQKKRCKKGSVRRKDKCVRKVRKGSRRGRRGYR
jgi:hypothetical protein